MGQVKTLLAKIHTARPAENGPGVQVWKCFRESEPGGGWGGACIQKLCPARGDQMTLSFDTASKKLKSLDVNNTDMDDPKDVVSRQCRWRACLMERTMFSRPFWMRRRRSFKLQPQIQTTSTSEGSRRIDSHSGT